MNIPEQWDALGRRLRIHLRQQPEMVTAQGPRRWSQYLLMWALESVHLAYGRHGARAAIKEIVDDYFTSKTGGI